VAEIFMPRLNYLSTSVSPKSETARQLALRTSTAPKEANDQLTCAVIDH
jgi:hypothetical protein